LRRPGQRSGGPARIPRIGVAKQGDESALPEILPPPTRPLAMKAPEALLVVAHQGTDQFPAGSDLPQESARDGGGRRRDDHGVERTPPRCPEATVPDQNGDPFDSRLTQVAAGLGGQLGEELDGKHASGSGGPENGCQIAAAGADLQHGSARREVEGLDHYRDDPWLRASLPVADGEGSIRVRGQALAGGKKELTGHAPQGRQGRPADQLALKRSEKLRTVSTQLWLRIWMQWSTS